MTLEQRLTQIENEYITTLHEAGHIKRLIKALRLAIYYFDGEAAHEIIQAKCLKILEERCS